MSKEEYQNRLYYRGRFGLVSKNGIKDIFIIGNKPFKISFDTALKNEKNSVISENIFSDRLIWQMGFENSEELEFTYILSNEFNELEEKYNEYCSKNFFIIYASKLLK